MPTARFGMGVASVGNTVYAIGGSVVREVWEPTDISEAYTLPTILSINMNSVWLSSTHFSSSYDFSSILPHGVYQIDVSIAFGLDEIMTVLDDHNFFVFDYAGEISDTTFPPKPFVTAWGDGSTTQLSARALVEDPESEIVAYRYAIGITPGGTEVINWTDTSSFEINRTGLILQPNQPYYVSFIARNIGGLWSLVGVSNAVINGASLEFIFLHVITR